MAGRMASPSLVSATYEVESDVGVVEGFVYSADYDGGAAASIVVIVQDANVHCISGGDNGRGLTPVNADFRRRFTGEAGWHFGSYATAHLQG